MSVSRLLVVLVPLAGACLIGADGAEPAPPVRFTEILIQDKYGYAYGIAAADLDGDGDVDLVSSNTTGDCLYWFENDGKGNFTRHYVMKDEPGWFERLAVGDIDGDGKPDIVVVKNLHGDVVWFRNSGKPREVAVWERHVITKGGLPGAYDVAIADIDGDGKPDVAASSWTRGKQFTWFRNPGNPREAKEWEKHVIADGLNETRTIVAADFNKDGKPDLLGTATAVNLVAWFENPGDPTKKAWKKHVIDDKSPRPTHGHVVDMDGDGDLDVVMALGFLAAAGQADTHQVVWYENVGKPGDGTTWKKHVIGTLPQAFEAIAVDLNGDSHLDVAATAWNEKPGGRVVWFENPGDPRKVPWKMHVLKENWPRANQIIAADLNGDKRPDLAAVAERGANEFRWWRNEGRADKK
jgi:antibiotic biosynthesis monooxygenase (ABM) superfamily enzyme